MDPQAGVDDCLFTVSTALLGFLALPSAYVHLRVLLREAQASARGWGERSLELYQGSTSQLGTFKDDLTWFLFDIHYFQDSSHNRGRTVRQIVIFVGCWLCVPIRKRNYMV